MEDDPRDQRIKELEAEKEASVSRILKIMTIRCAWVGDLPLMIEYHDREWGVPVYDDRKLFEFLVLDGAQAGLSWRTILQKRKAYRQAYDRFDPEKVARYRKRKIESLLSNAGIVRNRLKIEGSIRNARAFLEVRREFDSFDAYIWEFVGRRTIHNAWKRPKNIPTTSRESDAMSKDLKTRGFSFVGSTICYAFMQAAGMVNDHTTDCFRHAQLRQ